MAKSPSRKKSSKPNSAVQGKRPANQTLSAWVWSNYQGEFTQSKEEKVALINLQEKIRVKTRKVQPKKSKNKEREDDKIIKQNIRTLSKKVAENKDESPTLNKRHILTVGTVLLALFAVVVVNKNKNEKYSVTESQSEKPVAATPISRENSVGNVTDGILDPKAVELLEIASHKIREARKLDDDPNLDVALKNLRQLSDRRVSDALNSLREADKSNPSAELKSLINQLEKISK